MEEETFESFFENMDWEMLLEQRNVLVDIRHKKSTTTQSLAVANVISLVDGVWLAYRKRMNAKGKPVLSDKYQASVINKLVKKVDWKQLREDKRVFVEMMAKKSLTKKEVDAMNGILNGIDYFQDAYVYQYGVPEHEVFYLSED